MCDGLRILAGAFLIEKVSRQAKRILELSGNFAVLKMIILKVTTFRRLFENQSFREYETSKVRKTQPPK